MAGGAEGTAVVGAPGAIDGAAGAEGTAGAAGAPDETAGAEGEAGGLAGVWPVPGPAMVVTVVNPEGFPEAGGAAGGAPLAVVETGGAWL